MNTSSHNTPAVDLDTHYGFLFKKKNNPNRIIRHHSHLCFPSLQGGKEENTTSVCFSTGKDTETYQLLKKKNSMEEIAESGISQERPSPAGTVPGHNHQKATRYDAFTQLSVKI